MLHEYDAIIKDQMQHGIVEIVEDDNPDEDRGKVHYMPHHAVVRHDKDTTKVRVVYDGSARSDGPSLNDCLHAGPKFNQRIFDILLRFRLHRARNKASRLTGHLVAISLTQGLLVHLCPDK